MLYSDIEETSGIVLLTILASLLVKKRFVIAKDLQLVLVRREKIVGIVWLLRLGFKG